jgi:hypothetical protein
VGGESATAAEGGAAQAGAAQTGEPPPASPARAEATVRRVASPEDVPLRGPRVDAKAGDFVLRDRSGVAVVSATRGTLVDFGPEGGDDALVMIEPTVFLGLDAPSSRVESVEAGPEGRSVLIVRRMLSDPPLRLWTYVTFADGLLRLESVATAPEQAALAVTLGEVVAWGNVPTWVEGHGFMYGHGSPTGDFLAREGLGVAYALAVEQGHVLGRFADPGAGFHEWPRTGERVETIAARGASSRRVVLMAYGRGPLGDAVRKLPQFAAGGEPESWALPPRAPAGTVVEVARCDGAPYARFDAAAGRFALPRGCWRARLTAPGHSPAPWLEPPQLASQEHANDLPRAGRLRWAIRERGAGVVPARLLVRGAGGTPDPDWGEDPSDGAALDVIHTDGDGDRAIPPGRYHVTVTRGFEYTAVEKDVVVTADATTALEATLDRVVDTRGWIAADLHVHAVPSPDAPAPLADRVRALAAAGVEVAVATDHNAVTDYSGAIRERGLGRWLASIVGDEVTTRGAPLGHFNVFPLPSAAAPVPFDRVAPRDIVAGARDAGAQIVQVNHPRMGGIGYFDLLRFDPRDVAGWRARSPLAETGFDAIEIFNGDHYARIDEVERAMRDWYALLDAGIRMTATGNSDSHKLTYHECGVPRNLVAVDDDDPAHLDEARFVAAVRAGHVIVSSGPLVHLEVGGHGVGDEAPAGEREVHVTVDAPPWVDVARVEVVTRGGRTLRVWPAGGGAPQDHVTDPLASGTRRLDARFTASLAKGDWIVAIARGERPMGFLARWGAKPFGFTNPVWIE